MKLIPVDYHGFTAMDRRFSSPMLPWIVSEIRKRNYVEKEDSNNVPETPDENSASIFSPDLSQDDDESFSRSPSATNVTSVASTSTQSAASTPKQPRKRRTLEANQKELIDLASTTLCGWSNSNKQEMKDDPCDITGMKIAADLRQMTEMQRHIADKIINEVCFYGKAGLLKIDHSFKLQEPQCCNRYMSAPTASRDVSNQEISNNQQSMQHTYDPRESQVITYGYDTLLSATSSLVQNVNVPDQNPSHRTTNQSPTVFTELQPFLNLNR